MDVTPTNNGDSELRERSLTDCNEVKLELPKLYGIGTPENGEEGESEQEATKY